MSQSPTDSAASDPLDPQWEFEAAEPDVGFLTDSVTHTCAANVEADTYDVQPAEVADVTRATVRIDNMQVVSETTTYRCPACGATTACTEHWPIWSFEEDHG